MMQQRGHPREERARLLHDLHRVGQAGEQQRLTGGELEAQLTEARAVVGMTQNKRRI